MAAAHVRDSTPVLAAVYAPVEATCRYPSEIVWLEEALPPVVPKRCPLLKLFDQLPAVSPSGPLVAIAPTRNSSACEVVPVAPELGEVPLPMPLCVWSTVNDAARPVTSMTATALASALKLDTTTSPVAPVTPCKDQISALVKSLMSLRISRVRFCPFHVTDEMSPETIP